MMRAVPSSLSALSDRSRKRSPLALLVVFFLLFFSSMTGQSAFAVVKPKPRKRVSCSTSSKIVNHHLVCVAKAKSAGKKPRSKAKVVAAAPISPPPSGTPVSAQSNSQISTANLAILLKTDTTTCKLPSQNTRGDVEIGFPRITSRAPSVGSIRAAMVFVDFSDAPATMAPKTLYSDFSTAPAILKQLSYGKASLQITPDLQWLRMSKTSTYYGQSLKSSFAGLRSYMAEAIALASTTADFSKVDVVYVVSNPDAKSVARSMAFVARPGSEIEAGGTKIFNGAMFGSGLQGVYAKTLVHETSHTFGLVDDYNANYNPSNISDAFRFTGDFSIMGALYGSAPEYLAWEGWLMGWLDDSQVECLAPGNQTVTIQTVETPGGVKMAEIPISPTKALIIEYRRPLLADSGLASSGLLVYTVDTSIASGDGPFRVVGGTSAQHLADALLGQGGQLTVGNVTVKVIKSSKDSDTVNVTVG